MKNLTQTVLFTVFVLISILTTGSFAYAATEDTSTIDKLREILQNVNNADSAATSTATGFSRDGIYGCTGAKYAPVGMQGPSGANVPVFDAATHDQIRLLTYKECVLDGIFKANREALVAEMVRKTVNFNNAGFNGNPSFVVNLQQYLTDEIMTPNTEKFITGPTIGAVADPYKQGVQASLVQHYATQLSATDPELTCDVPTEKLLLSRQGRFAEAGGWDTYNRILAQPGCNETLARINAKAKLDESNATAVSNEQTQLGWSGGVKSVTSEETIDLGGGKTTTIKKVVTPGPLIAENLKQTIGTGLRQTENADEVDEIVSALMSHIGIEILSDAQGFAGLSQSFSGQDSYVNRLVQSSSANARGTMTDAGNSIVTNTIAIEEKYRQARLDSAESLLKAQRQLQQWETTCWNGLTTQAKADLKERVEAQVCPNNNVTKVCSVPVAVTTKLSQDTLIVAESSTGNITVSGQATRSGSTVDVVVAGGGVTLDVVHPTVTSTGIWTTSTINLASIPDGTVIITATEKFANAGGTASAITAEIQKATSVIGIELDLGTNLPDTTITATANNTSKTATIGMDRSHSNEVISQGITPLFGAIKDEISKSITALAVLVKIKTELAQTASTSGQRFILENLDALVASRALHSESDMQQAQQQAAEIEAQMQNLLEETKADWESGWCNPENWEQETI